MMSPSLTIDQGQVLRILAEETKLFVHLHQHLPIGRETEDIIDNALMRVHRTNRDVTYSQISEIYGMMTTK